MVFNAIFNIIAVILYWQKDCVFLEFLFICGPHIFSGHWLLTNKTSVRKNGQQWEWNETCHNDHLIFSPWKEIDQDDDWTSSLLLQTRIFFTIITYLFTVRLHFCLLCFFYNGIKFLMFKVKVNQFLTSLKLLSSYLFKHPFVFLLSHTRTTLPLLYLWRQ